MSPLNASHSLQTRRSGDAEQHGLLTQPATQPEPAHPAPAGDAYAPAGSEPSSPRADTPRQLPAILQHPEFRCPSSGRLLTHPVLDAHGTSHQRGRFAGGLLVPGTGVNPRDLAGPVMDDHPTRQLVADALAGNARADDAFHCPILQEVPQQAVVWRGEGIVEHHVYDAASSRKYLNGGATKSPVTCSPLQDAVGLRKHAVAAAYAARLAGEPVPSYAAEEQVPVTLPARHAFVLAEQPLAVPSAPSLALVVAPLAVGFMFAMAGGIAGMLGDILLGSPSNDPRQIVVDCAVGGFGIGVVVGIAMAAKEWRDIARSRAAALQHNARLEDAGMEMV